MGSWQGWYDEEPGGIPQGEELALDLLSAVIAKDEIAIRWVSAEQPAHYVGAHLLESLFGQNEVAPGTMHLTVFFDYL